MLFGLQSMLLRPYQMIQTPFLWSSDYEIKPGFLETPMSNWQILCQVFTYAIVSYKANTGIALHYTHCITLYYTSLHCTALHCTALHCTALHCIALHCTALYCIALHCTALHCTALHCTPVTSVQLALAFCVVDLKACCMLVSPSLVMAPGL